MTKFTASKSGIRLLVADDNPVIRELVEAMCDFFEYPGVEFVTNGLEAVEACKVQAFDMILMDCQMPEMDGYEATRHIRSLERAAAGIRTRQPAIIIAMTGDSDNDNRGSCHDAGMDDFLSKPFSISALKAVIDTCPMLLKDG
ncbi:MAG: response regulator [Deltaproteobacteria bacterium]|jgi:CheY-like chemotaxis protein|nr:response regulator [Deltaproteobacteria bacterium]